MHIDIQDAGPCKKTLKIEVDPEQVKSEIEDNFREISRNIALPGFRKGKVPKNLIIKRYGEKVHEEVKGKLLGESFEKAVTDYNLKPIDVPEPDDLEYDPKEGVLKYSITIEIVPEFELPEYKGIKVTREEIEVTEEEVDDAIENIREQRAEWKPVDGAIEKEDLVLGEAVLKTGGEEIGKVEEAGISPAMGSIGGMSVGTDAAAAFVGKRAGDEVSITFKIPENTGVFRLGTEHKDKDAELTVKIADVKRKQLPEIDEAWLEELDMDDMDELREEVRKDLERQREGAVKAKMENEALEKILETMDFDMPEDMIAKEALKMKDKRRVQLSQQGASDEDIEKELDGFEKKSADDVRKSFRAQLLIQKIAEKEKIFATEEDVDARIAALAPMYGRSAEELKQYYEARGWINTIREEVRAEKVRNLLLDKAEIVDKDEVKEDSTEKQENEGGKEENDQA